MAYAVVRLDNMQGTYDGSKLRSIRFYADNAKAAIENGNVVKLSGLEADEREVFKAGALASGDLAPVVVLVASPEKIYENGTHNLDEFINKAGDIARGYCLCSHDIFSVTAEALGSVPTVGQYVLAAAGTKLAVATAATNAIGKVIAIDVVDSKTFYVIEVL